MKLRDFEKSIGSEMIPHIRQEASCPSVMGWPEDDVSKWVSSHREETKDLICRSSQGENTGFCGRTRSNASSTPTKSKSRKNGEVNVVVGSKTQTETKKKTTRKTV